MGRKRYPVFVSYSRADAALVEGLTNIFRAAGPAVFRDKDSIRAGKPWRAEIITAIDGCHTVLVFWCHHASQSDEVRYEYERAISFNKTVVPVLLDSTEMTKPLGQFHAVDLRGALGPHLGFDLKVQYPEGQSWGFCFPTPEQGEESKPIVTNETGWPGSSGAQSDGQADESWLALPVSSPTPQAMAAAGNLLADALVTRWAGEARNGI